MKTAATENKCICYTDNDNGDSFYCVASEVDYKTQNSITMVLLKDTINNYMRCTYREKDSDELHCKHLEKKPHRFSPHMYKCTCRAAQEESLIAVALENL